MYFQTGDEVCKFKTAAGVVCIRIYNNLLFAGCYDGNIYVFNIQVSVFFHNIQLY